MSADIEPSSPIPPTGDAPERTDANFRQRHAERMARVDEELDRARSTASPQPPAPDAVGTCPTCGETGPDVMDPAGDYGGSYELRCGDDWHYVAEQVDATDPLLQPPAPAEPQPDDITVRAALAGLAVALGLDLPMRPSEVFARGLSRIEELVAEADRLAGERDELREIVGPLLRDALPLVSYAPHPEPVRGRMRRLLTALDGKEP